MPTGLRRGEWQYGTNLMMSAANPRGPETGFSEAGPPLCRAISRPWAHLAEKRVPYKWFLPANRYASEPRLPSANKNRELESL